MILRKWLLIGLGAVLLLTAGSASAQLTGGTLSGVVHDASGGVMPNAGVEIRNQETGATRTLTTDERGRYQAPNLSLGSYSITAQLAGFRASVRSGITLTVG
ncbi:MAG: carboxypeptidase regulatory-like domain-containing protein, partial [Acidobacteria bacterium]|nr:carboxypeptidase regulatory-like domain-containing protein [Acidobacteriota bacterium]